MYLYVTEVGVVVTLCTWAHQLPISLQLLAVLCNGVFYWKLVFYCTTTVQSSTPRPLSASCFLISNYEHLPISLYFALFSLFLSFLLSFFRSVSCSKERSFVLTSSGGSERPQQTAAIRATCLTVKNRAVSPHSMFVTSNIQRLFPGTLS